MIPEIKLINRNHGHWDIHDSKGRIMKIRGEEGRYTLIDMREYVEYRNPSAIRECVFKTVFGCMCMVYEELMYEKIKTE